MKESITKFDLEAAFKALDEIETPKASKGIKANKPALTEIFSQKSKFDALFEEYYDVGDTTELADAQEAREAEVAKAKLARIEKIVDLDADSPEDLLTSYVGKYIIQCPQCMTLFYKNPDDVVESEEDQNTVNVNEVCQHCGNESGYTLIGKVGEATEEIPTAEDEEADLETTDGAEDTENADESEEAPVDDDFEDFDLSTELDELNLDEEETEEEKTEEAFLNNVGNDYLVEQLTEETDLDVSESEFEELINSPEFKKPISDVSVRTMMKNLEDNEDTVEEALTEGGLKTLGKALGKKIAQKGQNIKDKISAAIDKFAESADTREEQADWVLANMLKNYDNAEFDGQKVKTSEDNKRFKSFIILGFTDKYSNGKEITTEPAKEDVKDLVLGMAHPQEKTSYKDADNIAKGWSMRQGNGPAYIYLAKSLQDDKAVYLCKYFKGELGDDDQLKDLFERTKNDLAGIETLTQGGMDQADTKPVKASEVKQGMYVGFDDKTTGEVIEVGKSRIGNGISITLKLADGSTEKYGLNADYTLNILKETTAHESLEIDTVMNDVDELQESILEKFISESLIESYQNVAGYRLTECNYQNNNLAVDGTIYFTSGNTRKTTYNFSESFKLNNGQIGFIGLNEKLGIEKQFTLIGKTENKTFITEDFKCVKH